MACDRCTNPVEFRAYSSYNADSNASHPLHHRYPMPMVRACADHLAELLRENFSPPNATQWVLVALPEEARRG